MISFLQNAAARIHHNNNNNNQDGDDEKKLICLVVEQASCNFDRLRLLRHHLLEARALNNRHYRTRGHLYAIVVVTPTTFPVHCGAPSLQHNYNNNDVQQQVDVDAESGRDPRGTFVSFHVDTVNAPPVYAMNLLRRAVKRKQAPQI